VAVLLGITVVGLLHAIPQVHAPLMVTLALCTTGLGVLVPIFRDSGQLGTAFGRLFLAAGTLGEAGPIVAMSLLLSQQYTSWQEGGFLLAFLLIVGIAIAFGMGARPPKVLAMLGRHMH
jgi:Kef-type K+ transport system membrane component KefB